MTLDRPWMKFYPRDWRGDQALRSVSIAARGLWVEMLFIMHEAEPYGHLLLAGAPIDNALLGTMVGVSEAEVDLLLDELGHAGVFSVTRRGRVIFSRRMVADAKRSKLGRKVVNSRWAQAAGKPQQSRKRITQSPESQRDSTDVELSVARAGAREQPRKPTGLKAIRAALETVVSANQAEAVIEHRQKLKQPLSVRAAELLANHYAQAPTICGLTADQAVDYQIEHGWRSFDPEWVVNARNRPAPQRQNGPAPPDEGAAWRAMLRRKAEGG